MPGHRRKAALVVVLRLVLLSGEVPAEFEEIIDRDGPVAETYISDIVAARSAAQPHRSIGRAERHRVYRSGNYLQKNIMRPR